MVVWMAGVAVRTDAHPGAPVPVWLTAAGAFAIGSVFGARYARAHRGRADLIEVKGKVRGARKTYHGLALDFAKMCAAVAVVVFLASAVLGKG